MLTPIMGVPRSTEFWTMKDRLYRLSWLPPLLSGQHGTSSMATSQKSDAPEIGQKKFALVPPEACREHVTSIRGTELGRLLTCTDRKVSTAIQSRYTSCRGWD